jgi:hypothetical protein
MVHEANTDSKMMMVSYKWPSFPCNFPWSGTYGGNYKSVLDWASNAYIMCDEYPGNYYGHTDEYWSKYSSYYGSQKHIADWFHLNIN